MKAWTILCVDDEQNVLLTLRAQLLRHFPEYAIEIAESGPDALELMDEIVNRGGEVPLVIADQTMPGMKGDELLIELHARYPQMLKVMLTGQAQAEAVSNVANQGSLYRFLSKPWHEVDLTLTVTEALRRYRQEQQMAQQQLALAQANQDLTPLNVELGQQVSDHIQALKSALDFNQRVIATVQEGVIVWDQTLRYRVWNRVMEDLSGLPAAAVLDQHCLDLFPFLQENGVFSLLQRALAGETVFAPDTFFEVPSTGKSGWTADRFTPLHNAQGTIVGVLGTVHDITERKQAELALQESEAQNRAILSAIPDIMTVINAEGQYLSYAHNQFAGKLLPSVDLDLTGMHVTDVLPQEIASQLRAVLEQVLSTGEMQIYEQQIRFGDRIQYEEVRIVPYQQDCVLCMVRDISAAKSIETERQKIEAALQKSAVSLAEAQRIAQVGNWEVDLTTQAVSWSKELFRLYGRDSARWQPTYNEFQQQIPAEDWAAFEQVLEQAIAEGLPYTIEHRVIRPNGDLRYALSKGVPQVNAEGQVVKLFGTTQDITATKQANVQLRESQQFIQKIADSSPNVIYIYDLAQQRNVYINREVVTFLGYTSAEVEGEAGQSLVSLMHRDDLEQAMAHFARLATLPDGAIAEFEYRMRHKNGEWRWFASRDTVFDRAADGCVSQILGNAQDITERKQAEASLRQAEAQLRASQEHLHLTLEFTGIGAWSWQPTTGTYEWNGKMEELLELPPGLDDMFQRWCDRIHAEDVDRVQANIQQALATQTAFAEEYCYRLLDSRLVWRWVKGQGLYTEAGDLEKVLGVVQDITERKQAEVTLANLEAEQRSILDNIPSFVVEVDRAGTMLFLNRVAPGFTKAEVVGRRIDEFTAPTSRDLQQAALAQAFATGEPVAIETLGTGANGDPAYYDLRIAPVDKNGQVKSAILVSTDITHRKQTELALQEAIEALQASELKLRQITNAIPGAVYQYQRFPNGDQCFPFMSAGIVDLYGITAEAVCTDPQVMWDVLLPSQIDHLAATIQHSATTLEPWNYEYPILVDGQPRWISGRSVPTLQADGSILWNGILSDISDRKQIDLALQNTERRYSLATRAAKVGVWEWNLKTNDFYLDPNIKALLGYTDAEIPNDLEQWVTYVHPNDREAVMAAAQAYLDGKTPEYLFEHRMLHKDGSHIWILVRGQLFRDEQGNPERMLGTDTDISARKQTELALQQLNEELEQRVQERTATLKQSQARYRAIVEDQTELVCRYLADCTLTFVNTAYCRYFEQPESALLGHSFLPLMPPNDREQFRQKIAQLTVEHPAITYEHQVIAPDGSIRWQQWTNRAVFDAQQRLIEYQAVGQDISDRKQAEAAIQRSEKDLRTIFNNVYDAIFVHDLDGTIVDVNDRATEMLGTSRQQLLACTVPDLSSPDCPIEQLPALFQQAQAGAAVRVEWGSKRLDNGAVFDTEVTLRRVQLGTRPVILACVRDISDRKRLEQELRLINSSLELRVAQRTQELQQAMEAAEAANRAKSTFLSNMSHELRTPLNAILGFSQLLTRNDALETDQQHQVSIINRSGQHLLTLINDILEMSKIEAGHATVNVDKFDLQQLLQQLEELFHLKAQSKGLSLNISWGDQLPQYIQTDETKLRQVLTNLLSNAIKFTQAGRVTLRAQVASPAHSPEEVELPPPAATVWLRFSVQDTGPGIASDEQAVLFQPFIQTQAGQAAHEGTGLGLPISRQFVQLMGGELQVFSRLGEGATFAFHIPVVPVAASDLPPQPLIRQVVGLAPNQTQYHILVVEDHDENRQFLARLLRSIGISVQEAEHGQAAVRAWQQWQPHLIWMDMRMPVMDGYAATRQIRTLEATQAPQPFLTKILALTASAFDSERQAILAAGCDDLVLKPVTATLVFEKIAEHLGVRYLYQADRATSALPAEVMAAPEMTMAALLEALQTMPPAWIEQLHQAARRADEDLVMQCLNQIPADQTTLLAVLQSWVVDLRLDKLMQLTASATAQPGHGANALGDRPSR
ncbi:PAS domain S-box protein [Nodosilinea sp. LEGE 07088]|uniref:PAS domain S-box protein n=1 Tax=Nodosilinea sp. LEGE 07088 TaxID=2777968 RepID=UPI001880FB60|nr:PAS domain S-box protein [Nodosilinea sp. LEGE 07088]MBE9137756.1 PAS domain S-box protein [Nodosilinea sp. LEGE 07088]